jgi:hypothetical protein
MKVVAGIEGILRFSLTNLKGCNVSITEGRDIWSVPLKWAQVAWYTYQVP